MTKVSISEAIKMAGVSRSHFYKEYVNKGVLSFSHKGKQKLIDVSELVRVFGNIHVENNEQEHLRTSENTDKNMISLLEKQIEVYQKRETEYQKREVWLQEMLEKMQLQNQALLPGVKKKWWRFW